MDATDIDWCLTCNCRLEGPWAYCSQDCQDKAAYRRLTDLPSTSLPLAAFPQLLTASESDDDDDDDDLPIYHQIVPVEPPQALPQSESSRWTWDQIDSWRISVCPAKSAPVPRPSYRTPKLLNKQRIVPPTLCMSKPQAHAESTRQNTFYQPSTMLSTISSRFLRCTAPVAISPSASTDSFMTPASSIATSPAEEKLPQDVWWSIKREPEPIESSPVSRSISIKRKPRVECPAPQGQIHRPPPPPQPLIYVSEDHPSRLRGRSLKPQHTHP